MAKPLWIWRLWKARILSAAAVSVSRNDVDYLVTEYGVAALRGRTLRQRAKALIGIAHPAFQPGLIEEYENRFFQKFDGLPQQRAVGV